MQTNRRSVLTGTAAALAGVAVVNVAAIAAAKAAEPDPIFAAIEYHRHWEAEHCRLWSLMDEAEGEAQEIYGYRPIPLVTFNNHTIGLESLDHHRDLMLEKPGADRKKVQREYRNAKKRLEKIERAGPEWDERAGFTTLRAEVEVAWKSNTDGFLALLAAKPTTTAGAAALLRYLHAWSKGQASAWLHDWNGEIKTAGAGFMLVLADAIERMGAQS